MDWLKPEVTITFTITEVPPDRYPLEVDFTVFLQPLIIDETKK